MIEGPNFCWLHLPKTGGTSTAHLFRSLGIPNVEVDPDEVDEKHQSLAIRHQSKEKNQNKLTIITTRRLTDWLLSDWHHKTITMGLKLSFTPVKSGLFYSLRLGGTWVAADYWIHFFNAQSCDRVVRLEHLEHDSNQLVLPLLPEGTPELKFPKRNSNRYQREREFFFGSSDLKRIYSNNPAWTSWEASTYGDLAKINPMKRLKAKLSDLRPSAPS